MYSKKMQKLLGLLCLVLLVVVSAAGCSLLQNSEGLASPVEELDTRLVQANNTFGINLFRELNLMEDGENILISPASILTALAMTYNGAEGETRTAMETVLLLEGMERDEVNRLFADLLTILRNPDPKVELAIANSLWARNGIDFYEDFLQRNKDYFEAEITDIDFDDPEAADLINSWVKKQTRNKIEEIVEPPINPETILFLINALYFKGEWSEQFDPDMTDQISFHLSDGTTKQHPVMFREDNFRYLETDSFQAVSLPYGKNERISMYLFLPTERVTVEQLISKLNYANWEQWLSSFRHMEGMIGLPRFSFDYEVSLNDALDAMGMGIAFDDNLADFSAMHPIPPRLVISEVKHKTFIEVNEEGTEAAAVTSVEVGVTAMPERFSMIMDRPFMFAIVDDMTGTILFLGSVYEPM